MAAALNKTVTALAPTWTPSPTATPLPPTLTPLPTSTPSPTATATPETPSGAVVACVRPVQGLGPNIVLRDPLEASDVILTRWADAVSPSHITWSPDGAWILFVSGQDFLSSRDFSHNVFRIRPDGTELSMITGDYLDPATAPGPYTAVSGHVAGAPGACQVYAQGATGPVLSDETGAFELVGVPTMARWVRAVYQDGDTIREAVGNLAIQDEAFAPITLTLTTNGQGWRQADLHPNGQLLAGTTYTWTLQSDGEIATRFAGEIYDIESQSMLNMLENPDSAAIEGIVWTPDGNEIIGALTSEEAAYLWRWDAQGSSLGALVEIPRPDDDLISVAHPAFSPDGAMIVFELRHQYWWSDPATFKTDLVIAAADGSSVTALTSNEAGEHAREPSWTANGKVVYYRYSAGEPDVPYAELTGADLWSILVSNAVATQWTSDGQTFMPSCRAPRQ